MGGFVEEKNASPNFVLKVKADCVFSKYLCACQK